MESKFKFEPMKIEATEQQLVGLGGLGTLLEIFDKSFGEKFSECLPPRNSFNSKGNYRLGMIQVGSLLCGHDCLADLEEFRDSPMARELFQGPTPAPRTMGDYLRDFNEEHLSKLRKFLTWQASYIRSRIDKYKGTPVHLSQDTSAHEQSGKKMEGLAFNYKGQWCLDSQAVYDEAGLCYGSELRSGNTKSGSDFHELLTTSVSLWKFQDDKRWSADSAYCHQDCIQTLVRLGVTFTITAHDGTTSWRSFVDTVSNWKTWQFTKEQVEQSEETGVSLPQVEVGSFLWQPPWAQNLRFQIVVKRSWLEEEKRWDYYGIITNFSLYYNSPQQVVEFHNERSNCENFIREGKYGFDLLHFPCLKLQANEAYLLLAMVAHNLLRFAALLIDSQHPSFAKRFRRQFLYAPAKMITHARKTVLKVSLSFFKEVTRLKQAWQSSLYPAPALATV